MKRDFVRKEGWNRNAKKSVAQTSGKLSLARKPLATSLRQSPSIKLAASLLIIKKVTKMTTTRILFPAVPIRELAKVCVASCGIKRSLSSPAERTYSRKRFGSKEVGSGRFPHTGTKTTPGSPCARLQGKSYAGTAPGWSKPVLRQWQREPRMRSHKQDLTIEKKRERSSAHSRSQLYREAVMKWKLGQQPGIDAVMDQSCKAEQTCRREMLIKQLESFNALPPQIRPGSERS